MKKGFFNYLWIIVKPIVGIFYSYDKKEIKITSIILNIISIALLWLLFKVEKYIAIKASTATEYATSMAAFLGAFFAVYASMLYSIYKGKNNYQNPTITNVANSLFGQNQNASTPSTAIQPTTKTTTKKRGRKPAQVLK